MLSIEFFDKIVKIDDPVGAISVHGVCGSVGTLLTGLLATDGGLFYGGGFRLFGIQLLGVLSVAAYTAIVIFIVFTIIKKTVGLRCSAEEEIEGLDISEHGLATAYADWVPATSMNIDDTVPAVPVTGTTPVAKAVPVVKVPKEPSADGAKYTKITIVCNQSKFEALKAQMSQIGVTGMTVTQVMGSACKRVRQSSIVAFR